MPFEELSPKLASMTVPFNLVSFSNGTKRPAYNVFKYMDTPQYAKYTNSYLKTIGASSWKSIIPGFSDKKLKAMPNR